ncbi:MAG: EcsC family protein [Candidatus Acidiferrales bacterium]
MRKKSKPGLTARLLETSLRAGFRRAYFHVRVNPENYLKHLQRAHRLPVESWKDMLHVDEHTLNPLAARVISASTKTAALEGMGMGLGGMLTLLPDMGILSAITIRMLQKLSLIYGFEYATETEETALWIAAASAAGLDLGRDFIEKQAIERIVPRIIDRIAVKVGTEVAEKWSARVIPVLSAGAGGTLNYYFVRSWGRRAQKHFLDRHRDARTLAPALHPALRVLPAHNYRRPQ